MKIIKYLKIIVILIILIFIGILFNIHEETDQDFFEVETCPACYGINCKDILNNEVRLRHFTRLKYYNFLLNVKNVYYGQIEDYDCVLKKLAHTYELNNFDIKLCELSGLTLNCAVDIALENVLEKHKYDITSIVEGEQKLFENSEPIKCGHRRPLLQLYQIFNSSHYTNHVLHHFITLLAINPEPILIQAFEDAIPLPGYFGSCGRVAVEEYVGETLTHFYHSPWKVRANLSLQLLRIADAMTFNDIRLYLTDPSADNFAVNSRGKVKLIDVENIVMVDPLEEGLKDDVHHNDGFFCRDCLSFDYDDLCGHRLSDHNYFAICKGLLSATPFSPSLRGGLLHSIPESVLERNPDLGNLVEECASPSKTNTTRIEPAAELSRKLLAILQKM